MNADDQIKEHGPLNFYDPWNWDKIGQNLKDILVERGPIRVDADFSKDNVGRYFSSGHYSWQWLNGEKHDRR